VLKFASPCRSEHSAGVGKAGPRYFHPTGRTMSAPERQDMRGRRLEERKPRALRGWLHRDRPGHLSGRCRIGGVDYVIRGWSHGADEWQLILEPHEAAPAAPAPTRGRE